MALTRNVPADLINVFKASYAAVLPQSIIRKRFQYNFYTDTLQVIGKQIPLAGKNLSIVGAGKGVQFLAREIEALLGSRIKTGIVSIPVGSLDPDTTSSKISYYEGAKDNLPDESAHTTAKLILELVQNLTIEDILLVLITGGGSALMPLPIEPITLYEKIKLIHVLALSGADITELNIVRKRISGIKGGKLANCCAARIVTLIISDVVNDPFDLIASGPTVKNIDDPHMAINILKKYSMYDELPESVKGVLEKENDKEKIPSSKFQNYIEGLKVDQNNKYLENSYEENPTAKVLNFLLASNRMSVVEAHRQFYHLNFNHIQSEQIKGRFFPIFVSRIVTGDVKEVAEKYYQLTTLFGAFVRGVMQFDTLLDRVKNIKLPGLEIECAKIEEITRDHIICLIMAGETTVKVRGTGKGGRNQQLALEFSKLLHRYKKRLTNLDVYMLSAGTDGIDGPTHAAGAIGHINLVSESIAAGINVNEYLKRNDSFNFYKKFKDGKYHVITGHTNTNVMDIHLITIERTGALESISREP